MQTVKLQLISDYICPWCYLGKVRIERVKKRIADDIYLDIDVKPYVLYPSIPKGGVPKSHFVKKTKPGMGRSLKIEAARENINFNYKYIERIPYSLEAHRLTWLVQDNYLKYELAKKIFYGYFEEGQNIEDHDYLTKLAHDVGINETILTQFKTTKVGESACQAFIQQAKREFITVVPSIKLDEKFTLPSLQSAEVLEKYIRRAAKIQMR